MGLLENIVRRLGGLLPGSRSRRTCRAHRRKETTALLERVASRPRRRPPRAVGTEAEEVAVRHLKHSGWKVLRRNYEARGGEIDVVARRGNILGFIEVRYRSDYDFGRPVETVTRNKQKRMLRAARWYLRNNPWWGDILFLCVEVTKGPRGRMVVDDVVQLDMDWAAEMMP